MQMRWIIFFLAGVMLAGCAGPLGGLRRKAGDSFAVRADGRTGAASGNDRIEVDLLFLEGLAEEMSGVLLESSVLARRTGGRDQLTDEDLERYAYLLFRFQLCRNGLWEIADAYRDGASVFSG